MANRAPPPRFPTAPRRTVQSISVELTREPLKETFDLYLRERGHTVSLEYYRSVRTPHDRGVAARNFGTNVVWKARLKTDLVTAVQAGPSSEPCLTI